MQQKKTFHYNHVTLLSAHIATATQAMGTDQTIPEAHSSVSFSVKKNISTCCCFCVLYFIVSVSFSAQQNVSLKQKKRDWEILLISNRRKPTQCTANINPVQAAFTASHSSSTDAAWKSHTLYGQETQNSQRQKHFHKMFTQSLCSSGWHCHALRVL